MSDLISRQDVINEIKNVFDDILCCNVSVRKGLQEAVRRIEMMPSVDIVEVVRCKNCKHYNAGFECLIEGYGIERDKEWFCGDAERRAE